MISEWAPALLSAGTGLVDDDPFVWFEVPALAVARVPLAPPAVPWVPSIEPDWVVPVRHALGAFLLKDGQATEAEAVYREDLRRWPDNGWSLFGLAASLEMQGKKAEAAAVRAKFDEIWKHADVKIPSSCLCQK